MRRGFSFLRGVPLPAFDGQRGLTRCRRKRSAFKTPGGAHGVQSALRRFAPAAGWRSRFRVRRARVPFSRRILCRPFSPADQLPKPLGVARIRQTMISDQRFGFRASLPSMVRTSHTEDAILPWVFASFRVAGTQAVHRRGLDTATIDRPCTRLPGPIRSWVFGALPTRMRRTLARLPSTCTERLSLRRRRPFSVLRGHRLADPPVQKSGLDRLPV